MVRCPRCMEESVSRIQFSRIISRGRHVANEWRKICYNPDCGWKGRITREEIHISTWDKILLFFSKLKPFSFIKKL